MMMLELLGWTVGALAVCMLFDMGMKYRVELAWVTPRGYAPIRPSFFSGFTIRHVVLAVFGCLAQYIVRRHVQEISASVILSGCLLPLYGALLFRDVWKGIRASKEAPQA